MLHLSAPNIDGGRGTWSVDNPTWTEVEEAIRRLNGGQFCQVDLSEDDDYSLLISGGANGQYLVEYLTPEQNLVLCDPNRSDTKQVAIMRNGPQDFPENIIVELPVVLQAARTFLQTGRIDEGLCWME